MLQNMDSVIGNDAILLLKQLVLPADVEASYHNEIRRFKISLEEYYMIMQYEIQIHL